MKSFLFGAIGYPLLELAWRGRTHPSMALAGGMSTMLIHRIGKTKSSLFAKSLLCGAGITGIEAACGMIWNRRHQVWDYRNMPMNWRGQVCLPFTLAWCSLAFLFLKADSMFSHHFSR